MSIVILGSCLGCTPLESVVQVTTYEDPYFPEQQRVAFSRCAHRQDGEGDYHIIARGRPRETVEAANQKQPSTATTTGGQTCYLYIHLFWTPHPGKTFSDASTIDATFRYVITSAEGSATYTGTGFVYPKQRWRSTTIVAQIENSRLRLESTSNPAGAFSELATLAGHLIVPRNPTEAVELLREMESHARSGDDANVLLPPTAVTPPASRPPG